MTLAPVDPGPLLSDVADCEHTARGLRVQRLPAWVRTQFPDPQLLAMAAQPSGVRLTFTTAASTIELVLHPTRLAFTGATRPRGRVDLIINGALLASEELTGGDLIQTDLLTGATTMAPGPPHTATFTDLPVGDKQVELWLPHNESVELVQLRSNAPLVAAPATGPLWLHHGSSISHGSNATAPSRTWPAVAARAAGVRLQNLGLGGSALLDPFIARTVRDAPADIISAKMGINIVNLDSMRLRTFVPALHGFLDTIRDGHPYTPLLLITPIYCGIHEDTPGPGSVDVATLGTEQVRFTATGRRGDVAQGRLTLQVIRRAITDVAQAREDPELHLVDGLDLYGAADAAELPLPDGLHPSTEAHQRIGERFTPLLRQALSIQRPPT